MPLHRADGSVIDTAVIKALSTDAPEAPPKPIFVAVPGPTGPKGDTGPAGAGSGLVAYQTQTTWHINEVSGDDANDGVSSGTAIRNCEELIRRTGVKWRINTTVHIYLDSDITDLYFSMSLGKNAQVVIHGKTTATRSGTVTDFTDENAGVDSCYVTDTGKTWTPGTVLRVTNGGNTGGWAWVAKDMSSGRARLERPGTLNTLVDPLNATPFALTVGTTYNIETPCVIQTAVFDLDGAAGIQQNKSMMIILDCDFVKLEATFKPICFVGCKFRFFEGGRIAGFTKCCFTGILFALADTGSGGGLFLNVFFFLIYEGQWFFNDHPVFQNASPFSKPSGLLYFEDYAVFFDTPNPLVIHYGSHIFARHGLGGQVTGTVINVQAGGQFRYNGTVFTFTGQTNDVIVGGRTSMPRIDPTTNVSDETPLALTFANILGSFGGGGFGGSAVDLYSQAAFLLVPDDSF